MTSGAILKWHLTVPPHFTKQKLSYLILYILGSEKTFIVQKGQKINLYCTGSQQALVHKRPYS